MSTTEREQTCQPVRGFTDRALDAHLRTTEEREMMEWLERLGSAGSNHVEYISPNTACRLQRMLAGRMPEDASDAIINAMQAEHALAWDTAAHLYRTIRKTLLAPPAPKTKEVDVWRVEFCCRGEVKGEWFPGTMTFSSKSEAEDVAEDRRGKMFGTPFVPMFACIRVTGPHKQTVPA